MFKKILIANRGEIAVRIIRACHEMGIETVAIYSEADKDALHTQMADEAVCIGPAKAKESYLNMKNILSATVLTGAEAIHPGFGFLSENGKFAQMCEECNIRFIGPKAEVMEQMGNKSRAREIMQEAKVPIIPGSEGKVEEEKAAFRIAEQLGYPILIKASAGGGGKGIRIVKDPSMLSNAFKAAKAEAKVSFGEEAVYIEKLVQNAKHIEFQIIADHFGTVVHLGERDCSVQRKNQKILEEAPCTSITEELRKEMGAVAVKAAAAVQYTNAGTIEFLLDSQGKYYFMEMNTRIQVEHPVTELITGIDLIKEQINIAYGNPLSFTQEEVRIQGHAIECRINAEASSKNFTPSSGCIETLYFPGGNGVRVDSAIYQGYSVPPYYDSMLAKLVVHGKDRREAIAKMRRALGEFIIEGVETNLDFQFKVLQHSKYIEGDFNTSFLKDAFGVN